MIWPRQFLTIMKPTPKQKYNKFLNKIKESITNEGIVSNSSYYGYDIVITESNKIFVDSKLSNYTNINELYNYIDGKQFSNINKEIKQDNYQVMYEHFLPNIILKNNNKTKITEHLLESYIRQATSKIFNADNVLFEIRKLNKLDKIYNNKIDYILEDGTNVVINYDTQELIIKLFSKYNDVIEYMQENKDNFIKTINQIKGYH